MMSKCQVVEKRRRLGSIPSRGKMCAGLIK